MSLWVWEERVGVGFVLPPLCGKRAALNLLVPLPLSSAALPLHPCAAAYPRVLARYRRLQDNMARGAGQQELAVAAARLQPHVAVWLWPPRQTPTCCPPSSTRRHGRQRFPRLPTTPMGAEKYTCPHRIPPLLTPPPSHHPPPSHPLLQEVVDGSSVGRGHVLRSMTPARPVIWIRSDTTPHAIVGDPTWGDVNASVDVYIMAAGETAALSVHCFGLDVDKTKCLWFLIRAGAGAEGSGGSWGVYLSAATLANSTHTAPAAGAPLRLSPAAWHTLSIRVLGDDVILTVDGTLVTPTPLSIKALGAPSTGFVGIGVAAYGHMTLFDDIAIAAPPPPPPTHCVPPPPPPQLAAAVSSGAACGTPSPGTILTTVACSGVDAKAVTAWVWTAVSGTGGLGVLSPVVNGVASEVLCVATNASHPNPQTHAPSVELQLCVDGASSQLWGQLPSFSAGTLVSSNGDVAEVTKNEPGAGVLIEVWGTNGGLNQAWCASATSTPGVTLASMFSGFCLGACSA